MLLLTDFPAFLRVDGALGLRARLKAVQVEFELVEFVKTRLRFTLSDQGAGFFAEVFGQILIQAGEPLLIPVGAAAQVTSNQCRGDRPEPAREFVLPVQFQILQDRRQRGRRNRRPRGAPGGGRILVELRIRFNRRINRLIPGSFS